MRIESAAAASATVVTPSDVTIVAFEALYIGTTGDVAVVTYENESVIFQNVPVGILPIRVRQVLSTGTTASDIVGLRY